MREGWHVHQVKEPTMAGEHLLNIMRHCDPDAYLTANMHTRSMSLWMAVEYVLGLSHYVSDLKL